MARPRRYDPVHVQVRAYLDDARHRGLTFEQAWTELLRRPSQPSVVRFPHATDDRRVELEVLAATRHEWQASYEQRATTLSEALALAYDSLAEALELLPGGSGAARVALVPPPTPAVSSLRYDRARRRGLKEAA